MLIRPKLFMAFGAISALVCVAGGIALFINSEVRSDVTQIMQGSVDKPKAADGMSEALLNLKLHGAESTAAVEKDVADFEQHLSECESVTKRSIELAVAEEADDEIQSAKREDVLLKNIRAKFATLKELLSDAANHTAWDAQHGEIAMLVQSYKIGAENNLNHEVKAVEDALSEANSILLWSTLAILLIAALLAGFISQTFSKPLRVLVVAARRIGEGRFDTTVAVHSKDEFGMLAGAFNRMALDLQTTTVSNDYVNDIIKSMADSLIVVRPDRTIKSVNPSTLETLGYAESELFGQSLEIVLQMPESALQSLLDEASQRGISEVELFYHTKAGITLPVSFSASALRDTGGALAGLVCVAHDISERKQAEAALDKANKELVEISRQAGMAEVATGVLHNVGNVLNSVNVASTCVAESLKKSKAANLSKVVTLLREREADLGVFLTTDPKGKKIVSYLAQLSDHLAAEQALALKELTALHKNIEHIKDIVTMQQSFAKISGTTETLSLADLVEDALKMNSSALTRHEIQIVKNFEKIPPVTVEKHKVLQILVNLVTNAKQACDEADPPERRVTLNLTQGKDCVCIAVNDNGIGISSENLTRIFAHGFTTKQSGHGFGLHSSALAAMEMGGSLKVQSDGFGQGATFTLELPCFLSGKPKLENAHLDTTSMLPPSLSGFTEPKIVPFSKHESMFSQIKAP